MRRLRARVRQLFVSIVTVAAATAGLVAPLAQPAAAAAEPTLHIGDNFGIQNGEIWSWGSADANRVLDGMATVNAKWIRLGLSWGDIEPNPPVGTTHTYHWDSKPGEPDRWWFDRTIKGALDRGFKVLLTFNFTAAWATDQETTIDPEHCTEAVTGYCPPDNTASAQANWHAFVKAAVQRYKNVTLTDGSTGHVTAFEFYNEPNQFSHWNGPTADASMDGAIYAGQVLKEASAAVREVAPPTGQSWTIVSAGLNTSQTTDTATFQTPGTFVDQMFFVNAGADPGNWWFDALGIHPYIGSASDPNQGVGMLAADDVFDRENRLNIGKKLWGTEFGLCTYTPDGNCVSIDTYGSEIYSYMAAWMSKFYSGPAFLYQYRDEAATPSDSFGSFGLVRADYSPKLTSGGVQLHDLYSFFNAGTLPTVSVGNVSIGESNSGDPVMRFSAVLSHPLPSQVTAYVLFDTAPVSATEGSDYVAPTGLGQFLVFGAGSTTATATVRIKSDSADETNETFHIDLGYANAAVQISAAGDTATATIVDDDPTAPAVKAGNAAGFEGDSGSRNLVFNINLPAPVCSTCAAVTYHVLTQDGTATAGSDYTALDTTVTFNPGDVVKTVSVPVAGDTNVETNETFTVRVRNVGSSTNLASGTGTIKDDD